MAVPIRDLEVGEDGLSGTLSFSRRPHFCYIPWPSVFALVNEDGKGMVWPDDVPSELIVHAQRQHQVAQRRATMRAVPSDSKQEAGTVRDAPVAPEPNAQQAKGSEANAEPSASAPAEPSDTSDATADGSSPSTAPDASTDSEKPAKRGRSLPPYLRVVK
jgi:stringent starvation protein B